MTKLPRINVAVAPEQHRALMELGRLQKRSASSYLREMLDHAMPMLSGTLALMKAAEERQQAQPEQLQAAIRTLLDQLDVDRTQLNMLDVLAPRQASNDLAPDAAPAAQRGRGSGARRGRIAK